MNYAGKHRSLPSIKVLNVFQYYLNKLCRYLHLFRKFKFNGAVGLTDIVYHEKTIRSM